MFDSGKHGWDGFVCKEDYLDRTLPFTVYTCKKCGSDSFEVTAVISSKGKQDFIDECVSGGDTFAPEDWVNGFGWINISLCCCSCRHSEKGWLDFETM